MELQEIKETCCRINGDAPIVELRELAFMVQMLAHRVEELENDLACKMDDPEYQITSQQAEDYIRKVLADFPLGNGKSKLRLASELCDMLKPYLHNVKVVAPPSLESDCGATGKLLGGCSPTPCSAFLLYKEAVMELVDRKFAGMMNMEDTPSRDALIKEWTEKRKKVDELNQTCMSEWLPATGSSSS